MCAVEAGQPSPCSAGLCSGSGLAHGKSAESRSEQLILASCSAAPRFCQDSGTGKELLPIADAALNGGVNSRQAKLALLMMDV
jgi:hypothetical protein